MAKVRENPPLLHNPDGSPTGISQYATLFVTTPVIVRENWKAFVAKCETNSVHPFDQIRTLIDTYAEA